jgi:putative NADH-flavin reductase
LDPVVVQHALAGVDVVIQSLGVPVSGIDRPASSIVFRGDALLVAAMKKAGTKRLICVTGFGAGDSRGRGGLLYDAAFCLLPWSHLRGQGLQEQIIRRSGLQWIIVRPVILTDGARTGTYRALTVQLGMRLYIAR